VFKVLQYFKRLNIVMFGVSHLNSRSTFFSLLVMLVILVNCVFMASNKEEIPKSEYGHLPSYDFFIDRKTWISLLVRLLVDE